jgi:NADH-quinone oxidoreductase subunit N
VNESWLRLAPVAIPIAGSVLILLVEALWGRRAVATWLGVASLVLATIAVPDSIGAEGFASDLFGLDAAAGILTATASLFALAVIGLRAGYLPPEEDEFPAELIALVLLVPAGVGLVAGARHAILIFLGIELLSVPLYALVGLRRRRAASVEGAVKYFLLGAFAAGFIAYGTALLFAAEGTLVLEKLRGCASRSAAGAIGAGLVLTGLLFKVSAAPFHFWTPDAYEGAATPVTALMASATKVAAVAGLMLVLPLLPQGAGTILAAVALVSIAVGNLGALLQDRLKRLLAYSSIAHAGTILVALAAERSASSGPLATEIGHAARTASIYYLAAYGASALGAFGILAILERGGERFATIDDVRGLSRRRPLLACGLAFFLLSLAGIPPTGGFWGKYLVFAAAVRAGEIALAVVAIVLSVLGVAYYLRVVAACFLAPAEEGIGAPAQGRAPWPAALATVAAAAAVAALGLLPGTLLDPLARI